MFHFYIEFAGMQKKKKIKTENKIDLLLSNKIPTGPVGEFYAREYERLKKLSTNLDISM